MLPDSDEVNLSPAELQILSELDRLVAIWFDYTDRSLTFHFKNIPFQLQSAVRIPSAQ